MAVWRSQASGIIISTAWGRDRPERTRSSTTSSNVPESLSPCVTIGVSSATGTGRASEASVLSRAVIQLRLPRTVLISPLWAISRKGWASSQRGRTLVENRLCTTAIAVAARASRRSAKYRRSWGALSIPL